METFVDILGDICGLRALGVESLWACELKGLRACELKSLRA